MHFCRASGRYLYTACLLLLAGCKQAPPPAQGVQVAPHVQLVHGERRTIVREVGQPGFIYAYEQTPILSKVAGYIDHWYVDIGDRIKKDQLLVEIFDPELAAERDERIAEQALEEVQVQVAQRMVDVATNNWKVASSQITEAQANQNKYQAEVERWQSEVKRLTGLVDKDRVIDPQVLSETGKQLKTSIAARDAARATIEAAQSNALARQADVKKARVDVEAARAKVTVTKAAVQRLTALLGYTRIKAPYDGIVVARNADTGKFVQPAGGGNSAEAQNVPIYVVSRTDKVRIYVDVPEMDASLVATGTKAQVRVPALNDEEFDAAVTRTSWALQAQTRSLRAEIDLPNPNARLLPSMYAYGKVMLKQNDAMAIPLGAVTEIGNQNCCYLYADGTAVRTPVRTGISDGKWVEVLKIRAHGAWRALSGADSIILGDLSEITDGDAVHVGK